MRKRVLNVLKVAFGLGLLAFVAKDLEPEELAKLAREGDPTNLVLGVGTLLVAMVVFQWTRLHVLIKSFTGGVKRSLEIFYVGAFFNNLLPSNIGGDAVRLIYLRNLKADNWGTPFMLLLLHRLSGFAVLLLAGLIYLSVEHRRLLALLAAQGMSLASGSATFYAGLALLLAFGAGAFVVLRRLSVAMRAKVLGFLRNCRAAFASLSRADVSWLTLHTLLFHGFRMLSFYYLVQYFGHEVAMWDLVFVVSATAVVAVLPVTIAGLGIVEGSISGLLTMYGVTSSAAVAVALINRAVMLLMALIGGVIYLATRAERRKASAEQAGDASASA